MPPAGDARRRPATQRSPHKPTGGATSSRDGNSELYSVWPDGSAVRRLTWSNATEQSPAWVARPARDEDGLRVGRERAVHDLADPLQPLLDLPVEMVLVSHGEPVLTGARAALERALAPS